MVGVAKDEPKPLRVSSRASLLIAAPSCVLLALLQGCGDATVDASIGTGTGGVSGDIPGATGGSSPLTDTDASGPDVSVDAGADAAAPLPPPDESLPACLRTIPAGDNGALVTATEGAQAGDCIELADGEYTFPMIRARGTETNPIVIRAANVLGAVVRTGDVRLEGSQYVVVEGIHFRSSGQVSLHDCLYCRVSRFRMERLETSEEIDWLELSGTSKYCRIDHNEFGPQRRVANMVMLGGTREPVSQTVQYTRIDHNYFHDVTYGGGNGWELIRAGLSHWSFTSAYTIIEHNLFVRGDSDPETISVKSSDVIVRYNTLRATRGEFTLRHGNRNQVYGNYILGDGRGNSGIRIYGGDHKIYNNFIGGVGRGILVDAGNNPDDQGQFTDHKQSYDVQLAFNTLVNANLQIGSSKRLQPRNITVGYNIFQGSGTLLSATSGSSVTYVGNIVNGSTGVSSGVLMTDPQLVGVGDVFKIGPGSPAIDAADAARFPFVVDDIDGKSRMMPDTGADEISNEPAKYRLLTPADVGPMAP